MKKWLTIGAIIAAAVSGLALGLSFPPMQKSTRVGISLATPLAHATQVCTYKDQTLTPGSTVKQCNYNCLVQEELKVMSKVLPATVACPSTQTF